MKKIINILYGLSICLLMLGLQSWKNMTPSYEGLQVIVHKSGYINEIDKRNFEKIIHAEDQRWEDGSKVHIALLKMTTEVGQKVAHDIFDMTPKQFNKYWFAQVFEGRCPAPESFNSEEDLIRYVSQHPGTVGVVSSKADVSRVKVLTIND